MPTMDLTARSAAALACIEGAKETIYWASDLPGFGLRIRDTGSKSWFVQVRTKAGQTQKHTLGDPETVKFGDARKTAGELIAKVKLGGDPSAERQREKQAIKVRDLIDRYLAHQKVRMKDRSYVEVKRHLETHAKPLHSLSAPKVTQRTVVEMLQRIATEAPVTANRVRSTLSAMFAWGMKAGLVAMNPVAATFKPAKEAPRERVLTDAELALIWQATGGEHDHDRIVRLLMLTGARREEIASIEWSEIEGALWTLPRASSKNGLPHEMPLGPLAMAQLPAKREKRSLVFGEGEGGFSGWSRCKERLDARLAALRAEQFEARHGREPTSDEAKAPGWTLHDLRRTLSTWMNENGVEPHVVEAVLNHVSGASRRGVAGVYNKAQYREPKRAALALWEAHVRKVVGSPEVVEEAPASNVVVLARAG